MSPRQDSASEITLPRATALLGPVAAAVPDFAFADDVTISRKAEPAASRWHIELELDREQIARLYRLGLANGAVVWRDGLPDWRPLLEASELREAIDALKARAPSSMKSALRRATVDRIANMSRPSANRAVVTPARKRMTTDPALRLYASLNRRRSPPDTIEFNPAPKITVAPLAPVALAAPIGPAPISISPVAARDTQRRFTILTLIATALAAIALTALIFWLGPLRAARQDALAQQKQAAALLLAAKARPAVTAAPKPVAVPAPPAPESRSQVSTPSEKPISVLSLATESPAGATPRTASAQPKSRTQASGGTRSPPAKSERAERTPSMESQEQTGPDRKKIARALSTAAGAAADCGVGGSVRVIATFGTSGIVRSAAFDGPLPELTDRSCVLRAISRAKIPPFSGDPISVRKTVSF